MWGGRQSGGEGTKQPLQRQPSSAHWSWTLALLAFRDRCYKRRENVIVGVSQTKKADFNMVPMEVTKSKLPSGPHLLSKCPAPQAIEEKSPSDEQRKRAFSKPHSPRSGHPGSTWAPGALRAAVSETRLSLHPRPPRPALQPNIHAALGPGLGPQITSRVLEFLENGHRKVFSP